MTHEITVFSFKFSAPFGQWGGLYDSEENKQPMKEEKIVCLYREVRIEDPTNAVLREKVEEVNQSQCFHLLK